RRPGRGHRRQRLDRAVQRQRRAHRARGGEPARARRHVPDVPRAGEDRERARGREHRQPRRHPQLAHARGAQTHAHDRRLRAARLRLQLLRHGGLEPRRVRDRAQDERRRLEGPAAMKIRAQIAMVMNLDKCICCHTCSVTCKNVWTSRSGQEYAWWNNVETKPGIGYPKDWENQERWKGGWQRTARGGIRLKQGSRLGVLMKIFANPHMPEIDDYYEPFTFDYEFVQTAPEMPTSPVARPVSVITGKRMDKVEWGPNWEEILGAEFAMRSHDRNFENIQKEMYGEFENTFMISLPRICEHCLNPSCLASCPSGSIYKREEDGIVLIDQD